MKTKWMLTLGCGLLLFSLTACGGRGSTEAVDVEATVQAAVAATATAQVNVQATIDAAVQSTVQATTQSAVAAAPAATPTPIVITQTVTETVYVPENVYMTMTEEELAALIDEAVQQATSATVAYAAATTDATADGAVTTADVEEIEVYVHLAEETVAYAEDLLTAYTTLYGDTADAVVQSLTGIETELATIAENTTTMATELTEIEDTLNAGLTLAEETITQIENTAATAADAAQAVQSQTTAWVTAAQQQVTTYNQSVQDAKNEFAAIVQNSQPQMVAGDQMGAFGTVFTYIDTVNRALGDNAVSRLEMETIAQTGANAVASLNTHGGPFSALSPVLMDVTNTVARGDLEQARQGLRTVETRLPTRDSAAPALGQRDNGGERPGGNRPGNRRP